LLKETYAIRVMRFLRHSDRTQPPPPGGSSFWVNSSQQTGGRDSNQKPSTNVFPCSYHSIFFFIKKFHVLVIPFHVLMIPKNGIIRTWRNGEMDSIFPCSYDSIFL